MAGRVPAIYARAIGTNRKRGRHNMDKQEFSTLVDRTGLTLTDDQKATLFAVYPMFQAMVARATPPLSREAEPAHIFQPEVR
jgi:hypothetical protein